MDKFIVKTSKGTSSQKISVTASKMEHYGAGIQLLHDDNTIVCFIPYESLLYIAKENTLAKEEVAEVKASV